ncbi:MAG: HzsA-related protein [Planctomycetota bacterium]
MKRGIMFRNPLVDFDRILLVDTPDYAGVHESAHRNGYSYGKRVGSRIIVLDGLGPDAAERVLVPPDVGYIMRMDLSFDGERIVFGMKPKDERSFHLYEIGLDGSGLRQLTSSPYDDMDPIYLPDGKIMFSTSRGNSYVRCLPQSASTVLARADADGRNIYIVSRNNEPDYTPTLLADGRVLYTRWEYTERPLWRLQKLWRAVPGTDKVMFAAVGHHNVMTGCIGIIDVKSGREWPKGIWFVTADVPWPEVGDPRGERPVASPDYDPAGRYWSYRCPWPLGPEDFLVSAARRKGGRFDLFLMDIHGNRELVWAGRANSWYARPLRPRAAPAAIPDRVVWPGEGEDPEPGVLFTSDVYQGVPDLPRGKAKYLRVIQMDAKTYSSGFKSWRHSGPVISVIQEDGVKRILGTVPIEPDGSVAFKVPAGKALHFQLLDEHRRCVQIMRSFTGVMPGERRGCLGCHGLHSVSPEARPRPGRAMALEKAPAELDPPPWGADVSVSYERFCQPVLDKYCGKCHQGDGKGRAKLDLTLRGGVKERGISDPRLLPFKEPYLTLVGPAWSAPRAAGKGLGLAGCLNVERDRRYGPLKPMTMLSSTSRLIKLVMGGEHNKVKVEGEDLRRLIAWVDLNCVYRGDEEVREIPDPAPEIARRFPVPVKIRTAPRIRRLSPVTDPAPRGE